MTAPQSVTIPRSGDHFKIRSRPPAIPSHRAPSRAQRVENPGFFRYRSTEDASPRSGGLKVVVVVVGGRVVVVVVGGKVVVVVGGKVVVVVVGGKVVVVVVVGGTNVVQPRSTSRQVSNLTLVTCGASRSPSNALRLIPLPARRKPRIRTDRPWSPRPSEAGLDPYERKARAPLFARARSPEGGWCY